jgi:predicted MFS family arabinose efflux permease
LVALACGAFVIFTTPRFWPVLAANTVTAIVGDVFGPVVAALTLGLFVRDRLASRVGRNGAFDHAGNVAIALVAAAIGWLFGQRAVFLLVPAFATLAILAVLSIPAAAIDHRRARGTEPNGGTQEGASWRTILECRPLAVYAGCTMLFHFANAPLLPLVGQKLAFANKEFATAMMSCCIIAAQLVMLPIALFAGSRADRWGRKPILLIGFGILPVRAFLYTLSNDSGWLIAVQLLDGVGAGVFGVLTPIVVADLMRGTGRYNLALGIVATTHGVGASLSGLAAGLIVDRFGYNTAFLTSGGVAGIALAVLILLMPETGLLMPETGRAQTRRVEKALRYWQQDLPSAIVPPKS